MTNCDNLYIWTYASSMLVVNGTSNFTTFDQLVAASETQLITIGGPRYSAHWMVLKDMQNRLGIGTKIQWVHFDDATPSLNAMAAGNITSGNFKPLSSSWYLTLTCTCDFLFW
jgi:tripartite-type tricarboxylate transporter receptor subunit TctC